MKALLTLVVLLFAAPCLGQLVEVSDHIPSPIVRPAEVYLMSDAEYFQWATDFNQRQLDDLEQRREKMEPRFLIGTETRTEGDAAGHRASRWYGGNYHGTASRSTTMYPRRWLNPDYTGPGPLLIANPYCRPVK